MNVDKNMGRMQAPAAAYTIPTDLVDLPSRGKFYPPAHPLYDEECVEVRYMSTREEDILVNQKYIEKGIVLDKLIESILINTKVDVNSLLIGDKNAIIINARKNAYGPSYAFVYACQECFKQNDVTLNLEELNFTDNADAQFTDNGTFMLDLPISNVSVEIGLLTANDEVEINKKIAQKEKHGLVVEPTTEKYRRIIKSVNGNTDPLYIANFVNNMPIKDSRYLAKIYVEYSPDVDFTYEHQCVHCEHLNKGGVPLMANFFWPDL